MFNCKMMHFLIITIIVTFLAHVYAKNGSSDSGRVVNGQDVPEGKYPFIVSLQSIKKPCETKTADRHFCGGSVINDNTILTAAHCLKNLDKDATAIYVGGHHLENMGGCYRVAKAVSHPEWKGNVVESPDIGIIKLQDKIDFEKDKATKICLPTLKLNPIENQCTILGWGQTNKDEKLPKHLQEVTVTARKTSELNKGDKEMHYKIDYEESGASACFGDSGGPLVCKVKGDKESFVQFGVDSFVNTKNCNDETGYTNVALYIDWIKEVSED